MGHIFICESYVTSNDKRIQKSPKIEMQAHWGHAARAMAIKKAAEKVELHKQKRISEMAEAALQAARARSGAADVLTNPDYLHLFFEQREAELLPPRAIPTETALARFCAVAPVCKAWHAAIGFATPLK